MNPPYFSIRSPNSWSSLERDHRRPEWTTGRSVRLGNDEVWQLPRIDPALLDTHPRLIDEITKALDLAERVADYQPDLELQGMATALYHAQLVQLALGLLRTNYELPSACWKRLLILGEFELLLRITHEVGEAVVDSTSVWMPLYQASRPDSRHLFPTRSTSTQEPTHA